MIKLAEKTASSLNSRRKCDEIPLIYLSDMYVNLPVSDGKACSRDVRL